MERPCPKPSTGWKSPEDRAVPARLLPPFGDGRTWVETGFPGPVALGPFISRLAELQPRLRPYLRTTVEETFHQLILIRAGEVLAEGDLVAPEDEIIITMPLTGG